MGEDIKYDKSIMQESLKMQAWMAREDDYCRHGRLLLFKEKPFRDGCFGWKSNSVCMELNKNSFLDLNWCNGPVEVEITVRLL